MSFPFNSALSTGVLVSAQKEHFCTGPTKVLKGINVSVIQNLETVMWYKYPTGLLKGAWLLRKKNTFIDREHWFC